jgi:hypothetical protein
VDVDHVRADVRDEVVERYLLGRARLEPRAHDDRAASARFPRVLADHEPLLVSLLQALDDAEHPGVRTPAVGQAIGQVQDPHGDDQYAAEAESGTR